MQKRCNAIIAKIESPDCNSKMIDPHTVQILDLRRKYDDLRRKYDDLRRENRILQIAVSELERVSERDTLTPLYNRRYFLTAIHHRTTGMQRRDESTAIIYIDIDQLKDINDRYGYDGGDFTLMEIAQRLSATIRSSDVAARIGGDEFGLIIDGTTEKDVDHQIARINTALTIKPILFGQKKITLSASFGVAMLRPDMVGVDMIALADSDMRRRKKILRTSSGN